jgi:hypothetical protein
MAFGTLRALQQSLQFSFSQSIPTTLAATLSKEASLSNVLHFFTMSEEQDTWTPPALESICWIEIPSKDPKKLKVRYCMYVDSLFVQYLPSPSRTSTPQHSPLGSGGTKRPSLRGVGSYTTIKSIVSSATSVYVAPSIFVR